MMRRLAIICVLGVATSSFGGDDPEVRIEPSHLQGPRSLEKQTEAAAIRDYLQAWHSLRAALAESRSDLLDSSFIGDARDKLAATIAEQDKLAIRTRYQDRAHDLQVVFYSPEGLSIQIVDKVDYDIQILDHDKVVATQSLSGRYIAVLTPSEVRWRVRILQGQTN
jgi:hypothetical protein